MDGPYVEDKKYRKVRDHCHYIVEYKGVVHSICNLKYSVPKKIPIAFHNGSNYGYHFIIIELANEFEKIDKNGEEVTRNITYRLQFIDSARFMASSL